MATVFIPAMLRDLSGGRDTVEVAGATVREAIENLEAACPGIRDRLLDGNRLRANLRAAVDGVAGPLGLRQQVSPQSEIHFIAAVSGGATWGRAFSPPPAF